MMIRLVSAALALLSLGLGCSFAHTARGQQVEDCSGEPYAEAQVDGLPRLSLELALTPADQARGLMFRTSLPENAGMLFVFKQQTNGPFWNMNTLIPLTIAYIDRDGTILDLQDMEAISPGAEPTLYPPAHPFWYALEANRGWYAANGVSVGNVLRLCYQP